MYVDYQFVAVKISKKKVNDNWSEYNLLGYNFVECHVLEMRAAIFKFEILRQC